MIQKESNVGASGLTGEIWLKSFSGEKNDTCRKRLQSLKLLQGENSVLLKSP